jgi:hypothetical protein
VGAPGCRECQARAQGVARLTPPDRFADLPAVVEDTGFRNYNHRMPAKDVIHDAVKNALVNDGWTITDDPLRLKYKAVNLSVDLGAERTLAAEREGEKLK